MHLILFLRISYTDQDWLIGFMMLKIFVVFCKLVPESLISQSYLMLTIRRGYNEDTQEIFFHGFIIPYVFQVSAFIVIPHAFASIIGYKFNLDAKDKYKLFNQTYYNVFWLVVLMFLLKMNQKLLKKLSLHVKDRRYLLGHQLQNYQR
ncbi:E3 ubiquitin-protein ligase MARCH6 [Thelohanellus kitauei]|uniref:RING-type E3 ubiquitin transferase n=1 Tax=Thelohanellus kitauei TaxID=669202 RepID=A0A0C2N684_THEKT|nr:E3 ubiquitin-protein ligase MARCH6 [Thelohanellus kitauei]